MKAVGDNCNVFDIPALKERPSGEKIFLDQPW